MPCVVSVVVATALGNGFQKLGQPEPLSYLVFDSNSGWLQAAQWNTPVRFSKLSGLVPARSVPCSRSTRNWSSDRTSRHSFSDFSTANVSFVMRGSLGSIRLDREYRACISNHQKLKRGRTGEARPLLLANQERPKGLSPFYLRAAAPAAAPRC